MISHVYLGLSLAVSLLNAAEPVVANLKPLAHPTVFARYLGNESNWDAPLPELKQAWKLPKTPENFFWEQAVKDEQRLVVELIDNDGLPWPSSSALWCKNETCTVRIKTEHELPKMKDLFVTGTIFDASGKKVQTWTIPLNIAEGTQDPPPWRIAASPKATKPKLTIRKSRRR